MGKEKPQRDLYIVDPEKLEEVADTTSKASITYTPPTNLKPIAAPDKKGDIVIPKAQKLQEAPAFIKNVPTSVKDSLPIIEPEKENSEEVAAEATKKIAAFKAEVAEEVSGAKAKKSKKKKAKEAPSDEKVTDEKAAESPEEVSTEEKSEEAPEETPAEETPEEKSEDEETTDETLETKDSAEDTEPGDEVEEAEASEAEAEPEDDAEEETEAPEAETEPEDEAEAEDTEAPEAEASGNKEKDEALKEDENSEKEEAPEEEEASEEDIPEADEDSKEDEDEDKDSEAKEDSDEGSEEDEDSDAEEDSNKDEDTEKDEGSNTEDESDESETSEVDEDTEAEDEPDKSETSGKEEDSKAEEESNKDEDSEDASEATSVSEGKTEEMPVLTKSVIDKKLNTEPRLTAVPNVALAAAQPKVPVQPKAPDTSEVDKIFAEETQKYKYQQQMIKRAEESTKQDIPSDPDEEGLNIVVDDIAMPGLAGVFNQLSSVFGGNSRSNTSASSAKAATTSPSTTATTAEATAASAATTDTAATIPADSAKSNSKSARAFATLQSAANKSIFSIPDHLAIVSELAQIQTTHNQAQDELENRKQNVDDLQLKLDRRHNLEADYENILAEQKDELNNANAALKQAQADEELYTDHHKQGTEYLEKLRAANNEEIAPYLELAESSRNALDDAERIYQDSVHSLQIANAQFNDALNSYDIQTSNANRAVEIAAERLAKLQDSYAQMKNSPETGVKELSEMNGKVARALAQLDNARTKAAQIEQETSHSIDNAQTQYYNLERSFEDAEKVLRSIQIDEQTKRERYIAMRSQADEEEEDIAQRVDAILDDIKQAQANQSIATKRIDEAQAIIEEAQDVHAHPEVTKDLEKTVEAANTAYQEQLEETKRLQEAREELQARSKLSFIVLGTLLAILIILLIFAIWFVFLRG